MLPPDHPPFPVLAHFAPHARGLAWRRAAGGFSGAHVWRGDDGGTPRVALKAWPPDVPAERLRRIHAWMTAARHLPFVPAVLPGTDGRTVFAADGRPWDCCRWLPGAPTAAPTAAEVAGACGAVARLHAAWAELAPGLRGPCPAVGNRLRALTENAPLLRAGPGALPPVSAELDPLLRRAVAVVAARAAGLVAELRAWEARELPLHPCVRDLRGDHVLFCGPAVTGVIDFGAAAVDHAGADLGRLLGDMAGADGSLFTAGLSAYSAARPGAGVPDDLVRLLARSGAACSALGWVVRLAVRREPVSDPPATAARLALVLGRAGSGAPS